MSALSEALWGGEQLGQARGVRGSALACVLWYPGGTCGLCPHSPSGTTQAEEGGVWVVWILAFCFGLRRSF